MSNTSSFPYILENGQIADANHVMSNLEHADNSRSVFFLMAAMKDQLYTQKGLYRKPDATPIQTPDETSIPKINLKSIDNKITDLLSWGIIPDTNKVRVFCKKSDNTCDLIDVDLSNDTHNVVVTVPSQFTPTDDADVGEVDSTWCLKAGDYYHIAGVKVYEGNIRYAKVFSRKVKISDGSLISEKAIQLESSTGSGGCTVSVGSPVYQIIGTSSEKMNFLANSRYHTSSGAYRPYFHIMTLDSQADTLITTKSTGTSTDSRFDGVRTPCILLDGRILYLVDHHTFNHGNKSTWAQLSDGTELYKSEDGGSSGSGGNSSAKGFGNYVVSRFCVNVLSSRKDYRVLLLKKDGTFTISDTIQAGYSQTLKVLHPETLVRVAEGNTVKYIKVFDGVNDARSLPLDYAIDNVKEDINYTDAYFTSLEGCLFRIVGTDIWKLNETKIESDEIDIDLKNVDKIAFVDTFGVYETRGMDVGEPYDSGVTLKDSQGNPHDIDFNQWHRFDTPKDLTKMKLWTRAPGGIKTTLPVVLLPYETA